MPYLVLGLALVVGLALMGRWLLSAEPRTILRIARWTGLGLLAGIGLFILLRGRFEWLIYAGTVALPFLIRWGGIARAIRNAAKAARGPTPGQTSGVRTRYLAMRLDHDTGELDGEVLEGAFAGRVLSALSPEERDDLLQEIADDPASVQVLQAWLDRAGAAHAGEEAASGERPGRGGAAGEGDRRRRDADDGTMTRAGALEVLGLTEGATEAEVREAHRRLMMVNHPDRGGSSWLAARINRAKDILLGRR